MTCRYLQGRPCPCHEEARLHPRAVRRGCAKRAAIQARQARLRLLVVSIIASVARVAVSARRTTGWAPDAIPRAQRSQRVLAHVTRLAAATRPRPPIAAAATTALTPVAGARRRTARTMRHRRAAPCARPGAGAHLAVEARHAVARDEAVPRSPHAGHTPGTCVAVVAGAAVGLAVVAADAVRGVLV